MRESNASSKIQTLVGWGLLAVGIAVFAVRFLHEGAYAVPRGGNLFGGLGALLLGGLLVWPATPGGLGWLALAASPVVLFFGLYATMSELEEVVSLYATDSSGRPSELRLWIVDHEDGEWVGMSRTKAIFSPRIRSPPRLFSRCWMNIIFSPLNPVVFMLAMLWAMTFICRRSEP